MKWPFQKADPAKQDLAFASTAPTVTTLRELYRAMFRARCIDETEAKLVARGEAFFHVPGAGHECSAVLNSFLTLDDYLHLHYRDKALMIARGILPEQFFNSLLCNADGRQNRPLLPRPSSAPYRG